MLMRPNVSAAWDATNIDEHISKTLVGDDDNALCDRTRLFCYGFTMKASIDTMMMASYRPLPFPHSHTFSATHIVPKFVRLPPSRLCEYCGLVEALLNGIVLGTHARVVSFAWKRQAIGSHTTNFRVRSTNLLMLLGARLLHNTRVWR